MPMKCVLEHCEFANGGHCALVCPKRLELRQNRQSDAEKVEACVEMLKRVHSRLWEKRKMSVGCRDLPVGVYFYPASQVYGTSICCNGKTVSLGSSKDLDKVVALRKNAEKAKAEGTLDEFLRKLKADRKKEKKSETKAKRRRTVS